MNKLSNYLLLFFISAGFLFLASCGEDTEDIIPGNNASISFQDNGTDFSDTTVTQGDSIAFTLAIDFGDAEAADLTITDDLGNTVFTTSLSQEPLTPVQTGYRVPATATGDIMVTAELTDPDDNSSLASTDLTITVEPAVTVEAYDAFLLAAPLGNQESETFFSARTGTPYSYDDVVSTTAGISETIDFGYAYGQSGGATISAPSAYPDYVGYDMSRWGTLNETVFRVLSQYTDEDFDAISLDGGNEIINEFDAASSESNEILNIDENFVIAFRTTDNRYGLIKVDEVVGTIGENDGIRIEVKVTEGQE